MKKRRGSLALRLLLLGVVQVAIIVVVGDYLIRQGRPGPILRGGRAVAGLVADVLATTSLDAAAAQSSLERILTRHGIEATLYREEGAAPPVMIASNVSPPIAPGARDGERVPPRTPMLPGEEARFERDGRNFVVVTRGQRPLPRLPSLMPPGQGLPPPFVNFFTGLAVVGLWAFGVARWVVRPLNELSRAARALGRGDLTARTGLTRKDELGQVGQTFDEMAERIQALVVAEKEMLANVSHELRTPLARIRVALDIAAEGDAVAARSSLQEIALDLTELESLIDDILTTMRLEGDARAATLPLHRSPVPASALADAAADRFRARHPNRDLRIDIRGELPDVNADAALFRRVLDNLLENAHKYSPDQTAPVILTATRDGERVAFEVADRGIGIPAEDVPHLFTAFFRGERSRSRGTGGVGLGLTLAKRIAEAHGGSIGVSSTSQGTTFRVEIPGEAPHAG